MSFVSLFIRPALLARFVPRSGYTVLSSKRGNKNFYKGRGAQPTGHHTKHGGFRLDSWKLPDYVVPDLTNFEVCGGCRAGRVAHGRGVHWIWHTSAPGRPDTPDTPCSSQPRSSSRTSAGSPRSRRPKREQKMACTVAPSAAALAAHHRHHHRVVSPTPVGCTLHARYAACRRGAAVVVSAAGQSVGLCPLLASEPKAVRTAATAFAPATVANLGPGFDYMGVAVEGQGDVVTATLRRDLAPGSVVITSMTGDNGRLSLDPDKNCCGIAAAATLKLLNVTSCGVSLECTKGLPLGSGLGSSAASAAAASWAVNTLFGCPLTKADLVPAGLASEATVSGYHADNIAPAIMGGFVLVRSYSPKLVLVPLPWGGDATKLWFCLVTPLFEAPTREMRAALPKTITMGVHVSNAAAGAGLATGILTGDARMLGGALGDDTIVEVARGPLIPGFAAVKAAAMAAGAYGCTISGAGPTIVAIAQGREEGVAITKAMAQAFRSHGKLDVAYAGCAQLCADGAREVQGKGDGQAHGDRVIRVV